MKNIDKLYHLMGGLLITLACTLVNVPLNTSILFVWAVAATKEMWDGNTQGNKVDILDFIATLGGWIVYVIGSAVITSLVSFLPPIRGMW